MSRSLPLAPRHRLLSQPKAGLAPTLAPLTHTPQASRPSPARWPRLLLPLAAFAAAGTASAQTAATLEPVVVTATRTPQALDEVLADVSVIDRAEIERSGAFGVADLLRRLPGIELGRSGGPAGTASVFLRGGETRHTALYIDGVRVDSQSTGGAPWEQIPAEEIERIEVVRGPAAAVYGSDAIAGVVQIFTRRGRGTPRPNASLSLGSHRTVQGSVGYAGSNERFDGSISASAGRSSGYGARTDASSNPDRDGWERQSLQARGGWQLDDVHRLDASLLTSRLRAQYDGFQTVTDDVSRNAITSGQVGWQGRWSADSTTRLQLGSTRSRYETQPSYYRTVTTLRDYTLQHEQRLGRQTLTGLVERREDKLENEAPALAGKRHQNALGLGWRGDFGAHSLQLQARHDRDSEFGGESTGGLAWGWGFAPEWRLRAGAATSFRVPTLFQRFSVYGNPDLEPEKGRNVELGLRWARDASELSLSAWRNTVRQMIGFGAAGPCLDTFGCYENVGRARMTGLTLAGKTAVGDWRLRGSLDWHNPRNLDNDLVLARRARRFASFGADTTLAAWTVGAEWLVSGARFDDPSNSRRLGGYGLLNLLASRVLVPGLSLEARVDNLADKDYEMVRTYATGGRELQLSLRWTTP